MRRWRRRQIPGRAVGDEEHLVSGVEADLPRVRQQQGEDRLRSPERAVDDRGPRLRRTSTEDRRAVLDRAAEACGGYRIEHPQFRRIELERNKENHVDVSFAAAGAARGRDDSHRRWRAHTGAQHLADHERQAVGPRDAQPGARPGRYRSMRQGRAGGTGNRRQRAAGKEPRRDPDHLQGATVEAELCAPTLDDVAAELERARLFGILEELVLWENTTNEEVLKRARTEIWQSWRRACAENAGHPRAAELFDRYTLPAFHDPFAGGGSLPLEAQRLGLEAHASDLNPVAVLINKAMIEIPPKFAGRPAVNPESHGEPTVIAKTWRGAQGLAEDVRHYGQWMRDEAEKRIGHLYPPVEVTSALVRERPDLKPYEGRKLTVIAWLWARTVKSPNPAFADVDVPLVSTFMLSTKKGKEAYVEPVSEGRGYRFGVKVGVPPDADAATAGTKLSRGSFRCLLSNVPIRYEYIDDEANAGRMNERLMAIVAGGDRARVYLPPQADTEAAARGAKPSWKPDAPSRGTWASNAQGRRYGFRTFGDYFTPRQLVALTTFSDLGAEATKRVQHDAVAAGLPDDDRPLRDGGTGARAYAEAVAVYLAFAQSKAADRNTSLCVWEQRMDRLRGTFGRQGLPMVWDYAETNPFAGAGGDVYGTVHSLCEVLDKFTADVSGSGSQTDAAQQTLSANRIVSTDPPYYDNIGYADLSDFFYVWLRRSLKPVFPELFATLAVPKAEELVATSYRHGGKDAAEAFFLNGMTQALHRLAEQAHPGFGCGSSSLAAQSVSPAAARQEAIGSVKAW